MHDYATKTVPVNMSNARQSAFITRDRGIEYSRDVVNGYLGVLEQLRPVCLAMVMVIGGRTRSLYTAMLRVRC